MCSLPRVLSDQEIDTLIGEVKSLPANWQIRLRLRQKQHYQQEERELAVQSPAGNQFRLVARRNSQNQLDFSIILVFEDHDGTDYRLIRYNGIHPSRHTNRWEKERLLPNNKFDLRFHIHRATERYQMAGYAIDGYAEVTDAYTDFGSALEAFLDNCGFRPPDSPQPRLL
jgi:hypothetical protein